MADPSTRHNVNESLWYDRDYRAAGLREANYYFGFVRKGKVDEPPVGALTVLEMAQIMADWIESGQLPEKRP